MPTLRCLNTPIAHQVSLNHVQSGYIDWQYSLLRRLPENRVPGWHKIDDMYEKHTVHHADDTIPVPVLCIERLENQVRVTARN